MIEPIVNVQYRVGRKRQLSLREVVNAILYLLRTGCQWRLLPHDFPKWTAVNYYWEKWRDDGTWERLNDALREMVREAAGADPSPSTATIDSQTVKVTATPSTRGYDGGKRVTGRKRHLVTCSIGMVLTNKVTAANLDDGTTAPQVLCKLPPESFPRLSIIRADQKYRNRFLDAWMNHHRVPWALEFKSKPIVPEGESKKFQPVTGRWVVERTFGWLGRWRRLSRDYERLESTSEATIYGSMVHLMSRRLERHRGVEEALEAAILS